MEPKSNLTIQVLSTLGGLLTAGFFIGFLTLINANDTVLSCSVVSTLLITTAILFSRYSSKSFLDAINITFYIAGCTVPFISLSHYNSGLFLIPLIGVSVLTFFFSKGFLLPFIAVLSFNLFLFIKIKDVISSYYPLQIVAAFIIVAFLLLNLFENKLLACIPEKYFKYKSVHAGFFVSCLFVFGELSVFNSGHWTLSPLIWISIIFIIHRVIGTIEVKSLPVRCFIYMISILICVPTFYAPYLSGSLLLIFLCFYYGYQKEFVASILLFIYAVSKFYYDLNLTLLVKSMLLFFSGVAFIIAWYFLTQKRIGHEKI